MAKLPERVRVTVLCYRRAGPDEVLVVPREARRGAAWAFPSGEVLEGASPALTARAVAEEAARGAVLSELDLELEAGYRVSDGPRAGAWTERYRAVELAPDARARAGRFVPHYEAKLLAGADAPRAREAVTRLRERARLLP